jgi:hypothetical protein
MAPDFTLHHHVARPISVHYHRPVARSIHLIVIIAAITFLSFKLWLFWIAYRDIAGTVFARPASLLLIPFVAGVFLIVALTIYGEKAFYRSIEYLQKKYVLKFEHAFKHK